jgi:phosphohistidine swiveling domain-containing protein
VSVVTLRDAKDTKKFGGKAVNLGKMLVAGLPVPDGFAVSIAAFDGKGKLKPEAKKTIASFVEAGKSYAVRSSATVEDALDASWAGQFESYLNVAPSEVAGKVEDCHAAIKARARAYAEQQTDAKMDVAVVVQEMVDARFAGVLFTKNPSDGANNILIEYVPGLGEALVHGDADPEQIVWSRTKRKIVTSSQANIPFDAHQLVVLAEKIEKVFGGMPQDIEWAADDKQIWIVQARPITTLQERGAGKHYLGDPDKLFYWGPSRALPLYMSDFVEAEQLNFDRMLANKNVLDPPKAIAIFHAGQTVWLNKLADFSEFVQSSFVEYERSRDFDRDVKTYREAVNELDDFMGVNSSIDIGRLRDLLLKVWRPTLPGEFALYGAEAVLNKRLDRLAPNDKIKVWGTMTLPDQPTFMQQIDIELARTKDAAGMAKKYPWIQNGYSGVSADAEKYFTDRLKVVKGNTELGSGSPEKRRAIAEKYKLTSDEVRALDLARNLAEFMDERKAWMMRSRRYILTTAKQIEREQSLPLAALEQTPLGSLAAGKIHPYHGWSFLNGTHREFTAQDAALAWDWYIEYRASKAVLQGIVVSNGGRHFINGEVFVAHKPTDSMPDDAVLVVPSTSPSYVPLMRKARALVTDHGGMMSHAAIVAREFGLPCIVGTKRATKILKPGDKVVLDLVKGKISK